MNKKLLCLLGLSMLFIMGAECNRQEKIREGFFISTTTLTINTSSPPLPIEGLPIPESLENIYPTAATSTNIATQTFSVITSNSEEQFSTSSINKNDPKTWPRFEFKELGFSMKLPFEKGDLEMEYGRCKDGIVYRKKNNSNIFITETQEICIKSKSDYSYYQVLVKKGNYLALHSIIGYAPVEGEGGILTDDKGRIVFEKKGRSITKIKKAKENAYLIDGDTVYPPVVLRVDGVEMIIFNSLEQIARHHQLVDYAPEELEDVASTSTIFNLPYNKNILFRKVVLSFTEKNLNHEQLITALKTIKFYK